ncbi:MAG: hypothetical protein SWZ49_15970 [Cyanobacteriota bacterium]|nr:hypothetical protein [Cyanobacteriota bacterium]
MKFSQKISISLFAATASLLSFSSGAFAGEGGAAGAAAFTIDGTDPTNPVVTGVAVAASVGKQDAGAAAFNMIDANDNALNSAFALGSAGVITMDNIGAGDGTQNMAGSADVDVTVAQENSFTNSGSINLGTASGETILTTPADNP